MEKRYILILYFVFLAIYTNASIWLPSSIVDLTIKADTIVQAQYVSTIGSESTFLIYHINGNKDKEDTLILKNLDKHFYDLKDFEISGGLVLFLTRSKEEELRWIGLRMLVGNKIYLPVHFAIPGKYRLSTSNDSISWAELKVNIIDAQQRINQIKKLRANNDNQKLLSWIKEQNSELVQMAGYNENRGWGTIGFNVFRWITESNIAAYTWQASLLYREIHFTKEKEWLGYTGLLGDYNGSSFRSYEDIDFLLSVALDDAAVMIDRRQALDFLSGAARLVYLNNHPIPDAETLDGQFLKQQSIRDLMLPLLHDPELKQFAFPVIRSMSNPMDANLDHRIDLEVLPLLISCYENERPSKYRSELASFIVHNSNKAQWKALTSCNEKIFMDLYQVSVDTARATLTFGISYSDGKEEISECPTVVITESETDTVVLLESYQKFKLPYGSRSSVRYITVDVGTLQEGSYTVYTKGKAGEASQYFWKSEYGEFIIK